MSMDRGDMQPQPVSAQPERGFRWYLRLWLWILVVSSVAVTLGVTVWQMWKFAQLSASGGMMPVITYSDPYTYISNTLGDPSGEPAYGRPTGTLYLTLATPDARFPGAYAVDIATGKLMRGYRGANDDYVSQMHAFTGDKEAFLAITQEALGTAKNPENTLHLYRGVPGGAVFSSFTTASLAQDRVIDRTRGLSIAPSSDNVLFYGASPDTIGTDAFTQSGVGTPGWWTIYLLDDNSVAQPLIRGMYPHWVSDTQFVYMADAGLSVFDITDNTAHTLWETPETAVSNYMLHVSEDRQTIVWTTPAAGEVLILHIDSLDPVTVHEVRRLRGIHAFWPTLSPDGAFVALETVSWGTITTDPQSRIEFFEVGTGKRLGEAYDMSRFDQGRFFITDWR